MPVGDAVVQQEPPRPGGRPVVPDLIRLLLERRDFGARKYGVELHTGNGRDAYIDALQELLDLVVYLHQAQMETAELREKQRVLEVELETTRQIAAAAQERVDFLIAAGARPAMSVLPGGGTP